MRLALRALLVLLGLSAVVIAGSILALGAAATAAMGEAALAAVGGPPPGAEPWPPTMDSELRFYAALWGAYGVLCLIAGVQVERRRAWVPWLALAFFAGGIGRVVSIAQVGAPHPFFLVLMAIELALPPVMLALWRATRDPLA